MPSTALEAWVRSYYERDDDWSRKAHERVFDAWKGAKRRVT